MSSSSLPVISPGPVKSKATELFQAYEKWLINSRDHFGKNRNVICCNPIETFEGIRAEIQRLSESSVDRLYELQGFAPGTIASSDFDNELNRNVIHVTIPWQQNGGGGISSSSSSSGGRGAVVGLLTRLIDEPKVLVGALIIGCLSASYTTQWVQWKNLALSVAAVVGLAV